MSVALYMDVNVRRPVTLGLRDRGVDVITAQEDGTQLLPDSALLDRATALGRVLFTQDKDFLVEAAFRQRTGRVFGGIIYARQFDVSIRQCIEDLELIAKVAENSEYENRLQHLPLR